MGYVRYLKSLVFLIRMHVLQRTLNEAIASLPVLFLERALSKKLTAQGIKPTKRLCNKLARHILDRTGQPFKYQSKKYTGKISLVFTEADADELTKAIEDFSENHIPKLVESQAKRTSKRVLKDLKSRWPEEHAQQESDLAGFRKRLEERWGKPLGQLRMLLTMVREWTGNAHEREKARRTHKNKQLRQILIRLLVRGCQVTDEIICLLENGFSDGAMARWRTLHEISVVAAVISQHGAPLAERYLDHQAVESKRAMEKYLLCYQDLGVRPLPLREQRKIKKAYDRAVAKYGPSFKTDYGWAAVYLKNQRPTFADLEKEAGRAEMRSYYQMGNDNIHAGIKSMYVRLGLLDYEGLLAGRSNGGLTEPGQNTAHTLTQLAGLVCLSEPTLLDDLVAGDMIRTLRDEIPKSFWQADRQLQRDDRNYRDKLQKRP
jgi:hypothetical protein